MTNVISCQMQHMKSKHDESQFDRLWSLNMHRDLNNQSWHYWPDQYKTSMTTAYSGHRRASRSIVVA